MSELIIKCEQCGELGPHKHLHDAAHGIAGTHMAGTERFVCRRCDHAIYPAESARRKLNLPFILDLTRGEPT